MQATSVLLSKKIVTPLVVSFIFLKQYLRLHYLGPFQKESEQANACNLLLSLYISEVLYHKQGSHDTQYSYFCNKDRLGLFMAAQVSKKSMPPAIIQRHPSLAIHHHAWL